MIISGYKIPDSCPEGCPIRSESFSQNGMCIYCPVFNCSEEDPILHKDGYRADWAKEFSEWFDRDMKAPEPELYLGGKE